MATLHASLFAAPPQPRGRLSPLRLAAFSSLALPIYAAQGPLAVYLPAIYAQHYGLPLATIGLIFLLERIWGTLADPLIGVLGDRGGGRRRSWIVTGAAIYASAAISVAQPWPAMRRAASTAPRAARSNPWRPRLPPRRPPPPDNAARPDYPGGPLRRTEKHTPYLHAQDWN